MSTVSANNIVNVIPSVVSAGGNALVLNGLFLTSTYRVPYNTVQSFATIGAVGAYFGLASREYAWAQLYFNGYLGASQLPGSLLIAQRLAVGASAWLQSGPVSSLTIAQIQAISGTLTITVDGYARTASSLNLSSATSYSAAASTIATALNTTPVVGGVSASTGGAIATTSVTMTAGISGNVLTVSAITGTLVTGAIITVGAAAGTQVIGQISGTAGGIGTYAVQTYQSVALATSMTATYGTLTLTGSNASGTFSVGQTLTGGTTSAGTQITALGTGSGGAGTYFVSPSQSVSAATITGSSTNVTVTYDSTSGAFLITSGTIDPSVSSIGFATGTTSASLFMTAATGAINSQGAAPQTPSGVMNGIINITQNWASFLTLSDPDDGPTNGPTQKLLYAAWTNAQENQYLYLGWDTDPAPALSSSATTSFGYQCANTYNYSGIAPVYDPNKTGYAAFLAGCIASVNFGTVNGRTTMAFRQQSGLVAAVTTQSVYTNLLSNGYNFYSAIGTANQGFVFLIPGSVTGPFAWLDTYINQIYMNAAFQLDLMELLVTIPSVPYTNAGGAMIETSCLTTINQMLSFGAIRAGVTLSSLEALAVNNQAGITIAPTIMQQGWYFQVQPATPQVRAARTTPPCYFWYTDGGSIQRITLNSVELQ